MTAAPPDTLRKQRTLGLMLAIGGAGVFLGLIPIVIPALVVIINLIGHHIQPNDQSFWLPAIFGLITIIAAIGAWIGRPPATRQAFMTAATLSLGVDLVVNSHATLFSTQFGSSLDSAIHVTELCLAGLQIAVYVFSLWYVNRAPARAFYRRSKSF